MVSYLAVFLQLMVRCAKCISPINPPYKAILCSMCLVSKNAKNALKKYMVTSGSIGRKNDGKMINFGNKA